MVAAYIEDMDEYQMNYAYHLRRQLLEARDSDECKEVRLYVPFRVLFGQTYTYLASVVRPTHDMNMLLA